MASKADTLKIAQADVTTISSRLASARLGRGFMRSPDEDVAVVVRLLEKSARNIRKSFGLNGDSQ